MNSRIVDTPDKLIAENVVQTVLEDEVSEVMQERGETESVEGRITSTSSLLKNSICVLRQAQHERKISIVSMAAPFVLRLSKDERRVFQQTASAYPVPSDCADV